MPTLPKLSQLKKTACSPSPPPNHLLKQQTSDGLPSAAHKSSTSSQNSVYDSVLDWLQKKGICYGDPETLL